ncbi:LysM peptidoglycan-binding domain-containing protein [Antarctobacter sp.]|uniref:LysM peptidoglycan-binding domain-containing protein n=1 Tax=Antarctobacter sp. TaxID=1872577 RepID=UPI002B2784D8|nr:LysM peptidoglycan-binding domain-containing protein [Antarctobacter sp.]
MSKIALYWAIAGAGTVGAVTTMVMTGMIQMPGARPADAPPPAAVVTAPDAPVPPVAPDADAPLTTADPALPPVDPVTAPDPTPVDTVDATDPATPPVETVDATDPATPPVETVDATEPATPPVGTVDATDPATPPVETATVVDPVVSEPPNPPHPLAPDEAGALPVPGETATAKPEPTAPVAAPLPGVTTSAPDPNETTAAPGPVETAAAPAPIEGKAAPDATEPDPATVAGSLLPLFDPGATAVVPELLLDGDVAIKRPSFDVVRAETDGFSLIAGGGEPGAKLEVIVDGKPVETIEIGSDGKFTTFLNLPPDRAAVISLRQTADEKTVLSEGEVIVAPQQVAAADITPERQPKTPVDTGPILETQPDPDAPAGDRVPAATVPAATTPPVTTPPAGDSGAVAAADPSSDPAAVPNADPGAAEGAPVAKPEQIARTFPQPEVGAGPDPLGAPIWNGAPARGPVPGAQPAPEVGAAPLRPGAVPGTAVPVDDTDPDTPRVGSVTTTIPGPVGPADGADPARPASDPVLTARALPEAGDPPSSPRAPTVLLSTPRGIEALSTAPIAPGDVALDSISYDDQGDVLLSGRGKTSAFVRIYLDNTPVTTSRIREDGGWRVELPEVDQGTYVLRIDQINERGQVIARVESPFLRESAAVLERALAGGGDGPVRTVTIQPGNTLWGISRNRYGDGMQYVRIFEANRERIRNPDLIYPGQIFNLPDGTGN